MTSKASGRSALILATGLLVCLAGPSQAAAVTDAATSAKPEIAGAPVVLDKYAKRGSRHWKKYTHRRSSKIALKSATGKKAAATNDGDHSSPIPASVADANAQLTSADTPTGNAARSISARGDDIPQAAPDRPADVQPAADAQVVSADQFNDVDRALREAPPTATLAMASTGTPAAPVMANRNETTAWDQSSLIGKIFIGFGALLTMASAARMFMA